MLQFASGWQSQAMEICWKNLKLALTREQLTFNAKCPACMLSSIYFSLCSIKFLRKRLPRIWLAKARGKFKILRIVFLNLPIVFICFTHFIHIIRVQNKLCMAYEGAHGDR